MVKIILLCGYKGSGKTAVARELEKQVDKIAMLESDALIRIKPWKADEHMSELKLAHATAILKNFLQAGYENIVLDGLIWDQHEIDTLLAAFPRYQNDFYVFWLSAKPETRYKRRVDRANVYDNPGESPKTDAESEDAGGFSLPSGKSYKVSTENKTARKIAEEILEKLQT